MITHSVKYTALLSKKYVCPFLKIGEKSKLKYFWKKGCESVKTFLEIEFNGLFGNIMVQEL